MQAGYDAAQVTVTGRSTQYARTSDEADRKVHVFHFCPECGSTVFYTEPDEPHLVVVMTGAFADPSFPAPTESGYTASRHPWVELSAGSSTQGCLRAVYPDSVGAGNDGSANAPVMTTTRSGSSGSV